MLLYQRTGPCLLKKSSIYPVKVKVEGGLYTVDRVKHVNLRIETPPKVTVSEIPRHSHPPAIVFGNSTFALSSRAFRTLSLGKTICIPSPNAFSPVGKNQKGLIDSPTKFEALFKITNSIQSSLKPDHPKSCFTRKYILRRATL